uniref:Cellulose biosynthesis cyclic di-GMP-binding regulatory protein BcsB n=1 Tax=Dictyoglomus thermophilum TaxID=14 RepID=A0A7C3KRV9_DICTH
MRRCLFLFLIILMMVPVFGYDNIKVYNLPITSQDVLLNLPLNRYSFWFYIPEGVNILDKCYLNLNYFYSETIKSNESFFTILINGYPISSSSIVKKEGNYVKLTVKIPVRRLKHGFNELTISTRQRNIEGPCKDLDNDANWFIINNTSILHLETSDKPYKISYFPYPFMDLLSLKVINSNIYLNEVSNQNLDILFKLVNNLSIKERYKRLSFRVFLDDPYVKKGENQILIGSLERWRIFNDKSFTNIDEDSGLLYLAKYNDNLQIYISGKGKGIEKSIKYLLNPEQVKLTETNPVIITSEPSLSEREIESKKVLTLKDLSYSNVVISGAHHQSFSFSLKLPIGYQSIQTGSYIELKFSHSPVLDPEKSGITLYINGIPVKAERLYGGNIESGRLKAYFPKDLLKEKEWNIEIKVYHALKDGDCDKRYDEIAWTKIDGDSVIYLNKGYAEEYPNLRNIWSGNYQDIYIWFPQNPTPYEISLMATLIGKISQNTGNIYNFKVILGNELKEEMKDKDIFFIGSFYDDRLRKIEKNLWVKPEGNKFIFKKDLGIFFDGFTTDIVMQSDYSPLGGNGKLYVILYNDESSLIKFNNFLDDIRNIGKIYGQVFIMTKLGNTSSFNLVERKERFISIFEFRPSILYLAVFIIVLAVNIIILIFLRKREVMK